MSAKSAAVTGGLVVLLTALTVAVAQTYQPDDPLPPGSTRSIVDLEFRTLDLRSRVEDGSQAIAELAKRTRIFKPGVASGPHSTIASDFLYLPTEGDVVATLTIRVADGHGQPLAGKRVQVSTTASTGAPDTLLQPEGPTDARGITTARVKPTAIAHSARFTARVTDDGVDVGQVAEMFIRPAPLSFLPYAFAPYYDGKNFLVSPTPLLVGRPTTITVPVTNRQKVAMELRVRFLNNEPNIGLLAWPVIGETETFVLQPGETREAKVTWTPTKELIHLCFKVEIWGKPPAARADGGAWTRLASYLVPTAWAQAAPAATTVLHESRQQNVGTVQCPIPPVQQEVRETQGPTDPRVGFIYVAGFTVLHDKPATDSGIVGKPPNGARLLYRDVVLKNGKPVWYYVVPRGGTPGWLAAEQSSKVRPQEPPSLKPIKVIDVRPVVKQTARETAACRG